MRPLLRKRANRRPKQILRRGKTRFRGFGLKGRMTKFESSTDKCGPLSSIFLIIRKKFHVLFDFPPSRDPSIRQSLAGLNSTVVTWLFWRLVPRLQNDFFEPGAKFLWEFPFPAASPEKQKRLEGLVDRHPCCQARRCGGGLQRVGAGDRPTSLRSLRPHAVGNQNCRRCAKS